MTKSIKKENDKGSAAAKPVVDKTQPESTISNQSSIPEKVVPQDTEVSSKYYPEDMLEEEVILSAHLNYSYLLDDVDFAADQLEKATAIQKALDKKYQKEIAKILALNNELEIKILKTLYRFGNNPETFNQLSDKEQELFKIEIKLQLQDLTTTAHYNNNLFNKMHLVYFKETIRQDLEGSLDNSFRQYRNYLMDQHIDSYLLEQTPIRDYRELQEKTLETIRYYYGQILGKESLEYPDMPTLPLKRIIDSDLIQDEIKWWQAIQRSQEDLMELKVPIMTILSLLSFGKLPSSIATASKKLKERISASLKRKQKVDLFKNLFLFLNFHQSRIEQLPNRKVHKLNQALFELLGTIHLHIDELPRHPIYFKRLSLNTNLYRTDDLDQISKALHNETEKLRARYAALNLNNGSTVQYVKQILAE